MSLASELQQHVDAGFAGIWVVTDEVCDAQDEIVKLCNKNQLLCASWTLDDGLKGRDDWTSKFGNLPEVDKPDTLLAALPMMASTHLSEQNRWLTTQGGTTDMTKALDTKAQKFLLLLPNFHLKPFTESAKLTQMLARLPLAGRLGTGRFVIVILSHTTKITPEYEKLFVTIKHSLPASEELTRIAKKLDPNVPAETLGPAVQAACGLTRVEAENAFCLSMVKRKPFDHQLVWDLKAQMIEKSGLMTIYRGNASASHMGGLDHFFSYAQSLLAGYTGEDPLLRPRGLLLLGVPGSGKSEAVKCLSNLLRRPLIESDIGRLMGGLVGETESNFRRMVSIVDAMAPCTLFIDEIEKALGGSGGEGRNDGGVGKRLLGSLLTWLNDHTSDVFFIGTCNDADNLPSALTRAERFDAKFFFDMPNAASRRAIWDIYLNMFKLPVPTMEMNEYPNLLQASTNWTGAEIRSCCRLAAIQKRPVWDVARTIVPVFKMYHEEIAKLRTWAQGNCLAADREGIYTIPREESFQTMISAVSRDAGANGAPEDNEPDARVVKAKKTKMKLSTRG